jgi:hypothetical protein
MSSAEMIISGISLALLGVFAVLLGIKCLGGYRAHLEDQPLYTMAWDFVVSALQTRSSLGYLAGTLFVLGGSFVLIGSILILVSVRALFFG